MQHECNYSKLEQACISSAGSTVWVGQHEEKLGPGLCCTTRNHMTPAHTGRLVLSTWKMQNEFLEGCRLKMGSFFLLLKVCFNMEVKVNFLSLPSSVTSNDLGVLELHKCVYNNITYHKPLQVLTFTQQQSSYKAESSESTELSSLKVRVSGI